MAGLREAGAQRPDLALMDLRLPDSDWFETARRMREVPSFACTPIVAVTGWVGGDDEERGMREGFAGYIQKPFRAETLRTEVQRCSEPPVEGRTG
jgi:CheY-like chemotaxis protein